MARRWLPHVAFDFGSYTTRVVVEGKVVWHQPTVLAWHTTEQTVIAIGDEAYHLAGKTPKTIQLVFPIKQGVVADVPLMGFYLQTLLQRIREHHHLQGLLPLQCTVAVPASISPVERDQLRHLLRQENIVTVTFVPKPLAVARYLGNQRLYPVATLDIGAQTVEVGMFVGREPVSMVTIRGVGGDVYTQLLIDQVKKEFNCHIGWQTAEKIKQQIGSVQALTATTAPVMVVRGSDVQTGTMMTVKLSALSFTEVFQHVLDEMHTQLQSFLQALSPDVITNAFEQGIYLTGGASQLRGLEAALSQQLQALVVSAKQPELDVVLGIGQ